MQVLPASFKKVIYTSFFSENKRTEYYLGCSAAKPAGATDNKNVDELVSNEVISCRKHCYTQKYPLSLLQNNQMCACYDLEDNPGFMTGIPG